MVLLEGELSSFQLIKMTLCILKQHWIRHQSGNLVIREIFKSSDQVYSKDRPESRSFVPLFKVNQNDKVCNIPISV